MKKLKTLQKILVAVLISIIVLVIFLSASYFLKINKIETNAFPSDMQGFPPLGNSYLFSIQNDKLAAFFTKKPYIKNVNFIKKYPSTLIIKVIYREKLFEVLAANGLFISDSDGVIFERAATSSSLIRLNLSSKNLDLGNNIAQNEVKKAIDVIKESKKYNISMAKVDISDRKELQISLTDGTLVIIGENSDPEYIVSSLQTVLKRFTIEGTKISKIDFRFDKPYITY